MTGGITNSLEAGESPVAGPRMTTPGRVNVLGVGISAIHLEQATELILAAVRQHAKGYVCVTGVHGVMESQEDEALRRIHNRAFLVTPDGMPMVWMGKLAGHREMSRVYGPDLMLSVCQASVGAGVRHFFYGGANGAAEELKGKLTARFSGLQVVGVYEPPFRPLNPAEQSALIEQVRAARPDVIWVGLSTPKQEKFMAEYLSLLDATVLIGVGAAFDMHSGRVAQAPRWMQRSGLEWFFRLCKEPTRLWRRYFKNNPRFVVRVMAQLSGLKKFKLD